MADYVFKADPNFNRVILKDVEGNKVFVNSQLELDFYTQPRAGGTLNGGYWEQIGTVGKIPAPVLKIVLTSISSSGLGINPNSPTLVPLLHRILIGPQFA